MKFNKFSVHLLVATLYVENPNGYKFIKHIGGDKINNNFYNLK